MLMMTLFATPGESIGKPRCCVCCLQRLQAVCRRWRDIVGGSTDCTPAEEVPAFCREHWGQLLEAQAAQLSDVSVHLQKAGAALPHGLEALRRQQKAPAHHLVAAVRLGILLGGFPERASSADWLVLRPAMGHPDLTGKLRKLDFRKARDSRALQSHWPLAEALLAEVKHARDSGSAAPELGIWRWALSILSLEEWMHKHEKIKRALGVSGIRLAGSG